MSRNKISKLLKKSRNRIRLKKIATNEYIDRHENLIIVGATGSGKSYIAYALGVETRNAF